MNRAAWVTVIVGGVRYGILKVMGAPSGTGLLGLLAGGVAGFVASKIFPEDKNEGDPK